MWPEKDRWTQPEAWGGVGGLAGKGGQRVLETNPWRRIPAGSSVQAYMLQEPLEFPGRGVSFHSASPPEGTQVGL